MSSPEYFAHRAAKYRQLAEGISDCEHAIELRAIAALFDRIAESVRDHDIVQTRVGHVQVVQALRKALLRWPSDARAVA